MAAMAKIEGSRGALWNLRCIRKFSDKNIVKEPKMLYTRERRCILMGKVGPAESAGFFYLLQVWTHRSKGSLGVPCYLEVFLPFWGSKFPIQSVRGSFDTRVQWSHLRFSNIFLSLFYPLNKLETIRIKKLNHCAVWGGGGGEQRNGLARDTSNQWFQQGLETLLMRMIPTVSL